MDLKPQAKRRPFQFGLRAMLIATAVFALVLGLGLTMMRAVREVEMWTQCVNNLKQVGLALHNYHDRFGQFPIAQTADETGQPIHSWRVRILPWFCDSAMYRRYHWDEPWDGPTNRSMHSVDYRTYHCPADPKPNGKNTTSYLAVVGAETAWPKDRAGRIAEITDGLSNTILLVEVADSGIHWMEPRDLDFGSLDFTINSKSARGPSSHHAHGVNACMADGSARQFSRDTDPAVLKALLTARGGEAAPDDDP